MERPYAKVNITEKSERSVRAGHPWVYGEEIIESAGTFNNGDIVDVYTKKDRWLGAGYYNDNSKIRVRIISNNTNDRFDEQFYERRVRHAVEYRRTVMGDDFSACRLVFGEADFFPGLTVDKFGDILVTVDEFGVRAIFATVDPRNSRSTRLLERLGFGEVRPDAYPHGKVEPGDRVFSLSLTNTGDRSRIPSPVNHGGMS
jgi:hypothetical protein